MWRRIHEIIRKEFRQTMREPRMRAMLFLPPLLQLIIFGYAVNLDVDQARIAWADQDHTPASRDLRAAFAGSDRFRIVANPNSPEEAQKLLDQGEIRATVRILPGFAKGVERGDSSAVQILLDGTDSNTASIVATYAQGIITAYSSSALTAQQRDKLVGSTMAAGGPVGAAIPSIDERTRVWFNPDLRSRIFFVPGVIVNIITLVTLMLTAMAIVREKEIGTMEQLMVTPIRPLELMLGKTLPFALAGLFEVFFVTTAALIVFGIPFRGNFLLLLACAALFIMSTVGVGLFISTISQTQQQAVMASFFFFTPAFMLSGFAFPVRNMPIAVQYLSYLNPVRYFITIVRGIFLKGTGVEVLWPDMLALAAYGILILGASSLRFHKRLD